MGIIETHSQTWRRIEAHIEQRLESQQDVLEMAGVPIDETENARGAIHELKMILELAKKDDEGLTNTPVLPDS